MNVLAAIRCRLISCAHAAHVAGEAVKDLELAHPDEVPLSTIEGARLLVRVDLLADDLQGLVDEILLAVEVPALPGPTPPRASAGTPSDPALAREPSAG